MIRIDFTEPVATDWQQWRTECQAEQAEHIAKIQAGQESKVKPDLYKRMKKKYFTKRDGAFHGKCAFCETRIRTAQHGDVEHYRPKGAVKHRDNSPVALAANGDDHPGYYWLAYAWENLLPSCVLCNQPSTEPDGTPLGKRNYFPLADETKRAEAPGAEAAEAPLLIHPVLDEPQEHLGIDATGVLFALNDSPRGKECIEVFGLNERDLPGERKLVYEDVKTLYLKFLVQAVEDGQSPTALATQERVNLIMDGDEEYTIAARLAKSDVDKVMGGLIG